MAAMLVVPANSPQSTAGPIGIPQPRGDRVLVESDLDDLERVLAAIGLDVTLA